MCTLNRTHGTNDKKPTGPRRKVETLEGLKSMAWSGGRKSEAACLTSFLKFANSDFRDFLAVDKFSIYGLVSAAIPPHSSKIINSSSHEIPWVSCATGLNSRSCRKVTIWISGFLKKPSMLIWGLATVKWRDHLWKKNVTGSVP